tara:strand:- start:1897 stop:2400 length:504 start_codon:yes stop_codon:yes gene_type:complete
MIAVPAAADQRSYAHNHDNQNRNVAIGVVGGLAALLLLKRAADRREEKEAARRAATVRRDNRNERNDRVLLGRDHDRDRDRDHHDDNDRGRNQRNAKILPESCYRTFRTDRGTVSGYGARCMQNAVARPAILPPQCIRQVRTDRGARNLYTARCMSRDGWTSRTARR